MKINLGCGICNSDISEADESSTPLLDTYTGAQTAISFNRKLRTDYSGSAFRVRRDSDDTEQDIGFSGNNVDESALTTFVGANSAYIVTAYDQSGNSNDWTQSTANKQPRIVSSGTVDKVNGKIAIYSDTTATSQDTLTAINTTHLNPATYFMAGKSARNNTLILYGENSNYFIGMSLSGSTSDSYSTAGTPTTYINSSSIGATRGDVYTAIYNNQFIVSIINIDMSAVFWRTLNTDYSIADSYSAIDYIHELILYNSDKSSDRASIETDINTYYSIY